MIIRNIPLDDKWEFKSDLFRSISLAFCGMIAFSILLKICFNVFRIVNLNENMSKFRIELTTL